jgi:hypothetical protein
MPDEHKTLEQRVAEIEFNLKKLSRGDHRRTPPIYIKAAPRFGIPCTTLDPP